MFDIFFWKYVVVLVIQVPISPGTQLEHGFRGCNCVDMHRAGVHKAPLLSPDLVPSCRKANPQSYNSVMFHILFEFCCGSLHATFTVTSNNSSILQLSSLTYILAVIHGKVALCGLVCHDSVYRLRETKKKKIKVCHFSKNTRLID